MIRFSSYGVRIEDAAHLGVAADAHHVPVNTGPLAMLSRRVLSSIVSSFFGRFGFSQILKSLQSRLSA